MSKIYNDVFNGAENEGDSQLNSYGSPNSENDESIIYINIGFEIFPSNESLNEDDGEGFPCTNCNNNSNDDHLNDSTPFNKIESNQNSCQKKTSDTSQEKGKENIKNDEKPNFEISNSNSSNNNENGNSNKEEKKSIIK